MRPIPSILVLAVAVGTVVLATQQRKTTPSATPPAVIDPHAGGVHELVSATPFRLDEPYVHWFRAEQPRVDEGWLVVLRVDPNKVRPTNAAMPVLYAGDQTVEPINFGHADGVVVGLVPGSENLIGHEFWFGDPNLAESVDADEVERQRAMARQRGCLVADRTSIEAACDRGGDALRLPSRLELEHACARAILHHAPGDRERAEGLLPPE